jgi:hypothetical protein
MLELTVFKEEQVWWSRVAADEPEIDVEEVCVGRVCWWWVQSAFGGASFQCKGWARHWVDTTSKSTHSRCRLGRGEGRWWAPYYAAVCVTA